jgi:hypothetical protein
MSDNNSVNEQKNMPATIVEINAKQQVSVSKKSQSLLNN